MNDWRDHAACAPGNGHNPDDWFPTDSAITKAKRICACCPVRTECLQHALEAGPNLDGIWGGTSRTTRRAILHERGDMPATPQKSRRYTADQHAAAVELYHDVRFTYANDWNCARAVSEHLGYGDPGSILNWVRAADDRQKATEAA